MTDKEYYGLIQPYEDAMKLLLTRLEVLNHSIYKTKTGKPVHNIQMCIRDSPWIYHLDFMAMSFQGEKHFSGVCLPE